MILEIEEAQFQNLLPMAAAAALRRLKTRPICEMKATSVILRCNVTWRSSSGKISPEKSDVVGNFRYRQVLLSSPGGQKPEGHDDQRLV